MNPSDTELRRTVWHILLILVNTGVIHSGQAQDTYQVAYWRWPPPTTRVP